VDATGLVMGRYTEKPNRYRVFWKTDTDTVVGIWKPENTEKQTKKNENIGYFGVSVGPLKCTKTQVEKQ
jgi:hypothetical protein